MEEIWKDIEGYEGKYQVSNLGRVKSLLKNGVNRERIMKQQKDKDGYMRIKLRKSKTQKLYGVHRLVAFAFIPNENNLPMVNHKDEDKANNFANNLEWCDDLYNKNYGTAIERSAKHRHKKVAQYDLDGKLIKIFNSVIEAEEKTNINRTNISAVARFIRPYTKGFIFRYVHEGGDAIAN